MISKQVGNASGQFYAWCKSCTDKTGFHIGTYRMPDGELTIMVSRCHSCGAAPVLQTNSWTTWGLED